MAEYSMKKRLDHGKMSLGSFRGMSWSCVAALHCRTNTQMLLLYIAF